MTYEQAINYLLSSGFSEEQINTLEQAFKQESKVGYWIPTYGNVECSVCGSVKDSREVGKATHYCDFCGAKMVEPQKSEEKE